MVHVPADSLSGQHASNSLYLSPVSGQVALLTETVSDTEHANGVSARVARVSISERN